MILKDIKNQEDVKTIIRDKEPVYRDTVPFHKELDFNSSVTTLLKFNVEIETTTLVDLIKDFIKEDRTPEENILSVKEALEDAVSWNIFEDIINLLDDENKILLGVNPKEIYKSTSLQPKKPEGFLDYIVDLFIKFILNKNI